MNEAMQLRTLIDNLLTRLETAERALEDEKARHAECERKMIDYATRWAVAEARLDGVVRFGPDVLEVKP